MARQNIPFIAIGNRGLVSPRALARVDLDRTRLSAETFENYIGKTQGSLTIRPGTKYFGSSINDTGAVWIEFVASTDDVALVEVTDEKMRIWLGSDAHNLALLERPSITTTVTLSDTGWVDASAGGSLAAGAEDVIPTMTSSTVNGVTISASSDNDQSFFGGRARHAADDNVGTFWQDTGGGSTVPSWLSLNFGSGNPQTVLSYSLRAASFFNSAAPQAWRLIGSNFDTGTYATDTGKWALEDEQSAQTGWASSEKRIFELSDTGTADAWRNWRLYVTTVNGGGPLYLGEFELFTAAAATQAQFVNGELILNATSIGALAKATKRVIVDTGDLQVEHSLAINVSRGPVTFRVGSTNGDDDYVSETALGTGYHNLAFTPFADFHITFQSDKIYNRIVSSLAIGDTGTVEITAPWDTTDLDNIRYDQSADVVYVDCAGVRPQKIERRGTGRSWSVVDYAPDDGPFLPSPSSSAEFSVSSLYGNTTLNSDRPFFTSGHVGALVRMFHEGQSGQWPLGALDAQTDAVAVTGIGDTGTPTAQNERRIRVAASGSWAGTLIIERSFDGPEFGFKRITSNLAAGTYTSNFDTGIDDTEDNIEVWYRARFSAYTSGAAIVTVTYGGGGVTGFGRITGYNSNTDVDFEVLSRFSDTGTTDNWQQSYWSDARGFPSSVALHGGRLAHGQGGSTFLTVADDYESFDASVEGDAGPIIRTLGSGPVDNIYYLISLLRLIVGTAGAEMTMKSSSLDEPLTPSNNSITAFSTQGSANLRAIKMDTRAIFVQRSKQRVFMVGAGVQGNAFGDYEGLELTLLVPELLEAGVVSIAIQRQPDTRIHCVLSNGTVAILTYEPSEEVIAWFKWSTTNGSVEKAMVLPGLEEDAVYYHIRRTINGVTKRYLEKWAMESECYGDTGLNWLADCAVSFSDTGRATTFAAAAPHLAGESVIAWGDLDTGSTPYVDLSPDVADVQTTYTVDTGAGDVTFTGLTQGVNQGVVGLPYAPLWRSSKLAYGAQLGTALAQMKRPPQLGLLLYKTHPRGIFYGSDTGKKMDTLPRTINGKATDLDVVIQTLDKVAVPMPSTWESDPRLVIKGKAPRPMTVLALVPTIETSER